MKRENKGAALAIAVSVLGVVGVWGYSLFAGEQSTEEAARIYVGQQWDIARRCLVGTPIGRGEPVEALRERLRERALTTIAELAEQGEPLDPDTTWPGECVVILSSLRADRSILRDDPEDAVEVIEVLAPRVIGRSRSGASELDVLAIVERADELADSIELLDRAMPTGASYEPEDFETPSLGAAASVIVESLREPPPIPFRRPFTNTPLGDGELLDELRTDERSFRLTTDGTGAVSLSTSDGEPRALDAAGLRAPSFWDDETVVWVDPSEPALVLRGFDGTERERIELPLEGPIDRVSICRSGSSVHVVAERGERRSWMRYAGQPIEAARELPSFGDARPPFVFECGAAAAVIAWSAPTGWRGTRCEADRCAGLPELSVGGDLQLALHDRAVVAVARARRADLPLARTLSDGAWSDPVVVPRGRLGGVRGGFAIAGTVEHRSSDGLRWRTSP